MLDVRRCIIIATLSYLWSVGSADTEIIHYSLLVISYFWFFPFGVWINLSSAKAEDGGLSYIRTNRFCLYKGWANASPAGKNGNVFDCSLPRDKGETRRKQNNSSKNLTVRSVAGNFLLVVSPKRPWKRGFKRNLGSFVFLSGFFRYSGQMKVRYSADGGVTNKWIMKNE